MKAIEEHVHHQLDGIYGRASAPRSEAELRQALADRLGAKEMDVGFSFKPPKNPRPRPSAEALAAVPGLPPEGFDPIPEVPIGFDLLWHAPQGPVAMELKLAKDGEWDVYGYEVLRDVHRMERLTATRQGVVPVARLVVFVSQHERWWKGRTSTAPQVAHGTTVGLHVRLSQKSLKTQWDKQYAPFMLARTYQMSWRALVPGSVQCLVLNVEPQG